MRDILRSRNVNFKPQYYVSDNLSLERYLRRLNSAKKASFSLKDTTQKWETYPSLIGKKMDQQIFGISEVIKPGKQSSDYWIMADNANNKWTSRPD